MIYRSPFPDIEIPVTPLHEHVFEHVDRWPDEPAFIEGPTDRTVTYAELRAAARAVAAGLSGRGFAQGDVFAIYCPNVPEYPAAFFGVSTAGGAVTTMNPLYKAEEVHRQLQDSGARFLLTAPQCLDEAVRGADGTAVEEVFVLGEAEGATPFTSLLAAGEPPAVEIDPRNDLAVLPYSSGTTGMPKGVMLTHYNLVANIEQLIAAEGFAAADRRIGILPFYHIYGMTAVMSATLRAGGTVVTMPRFDLRQFLWLLQRHRVTMGYLAPPIVLALARDPLVDEFDLSSLRDVMSGAAPLPESVARAAAARNGMLVRQGYGLTETSPVTHTNAPTTEIRVASVGTALPNTEWRIVDTATGKDADTGALGEVWVRGPQMMLGYLHHPEVTREMIDADDWLHTGDIGRADADGYLYVVDRIKEMIKYKGFQVAPAEIEAVVQSHPAVADAAVVPSPDEEAGDVPKAFVVLREGAGASAEEIMAHVAARVAPQKKVRRLEFIDAIPKTPSGKILRRKLAERERS